MFGCPTPDADVRCCRRQRQNTHGTEEREVAYPWHPWFGQVVRVQEVVARGGGDVFRCSLPTEPLRRWLELPAWMFDREACTPMRLAEAPVATLDALNTLWALLGDIHASISAASAPASGALSGSRKQIRGESDATRPRRSSATNDGTIGSVRRQPKPAGGTVSCVGSAAVSGARRTDRADDPSDRRTRACLQRRSDRGGAR